MKIEVKDVFAVEIDGSTYHLGCVPSDTEITEEDLIMQGDEENGVFLR
ncbi:MAG: hypothetical protein WCJ37_14045 [Syntrophus sp. (in: bacteria)]